MPFTFSHPAILVPLRWLPKNWLSVTALVIGSMAPDFEYFLRMQVQSIYSHSVAGLFWFDVPMTVLLAFIFHNIVRNSLIDNLPGFLRSRLAVFKPFQWNIYFKKHWPIVVFSALLGAASHLFWDAFTHQNGYFVRHIDFLQLNIYFTGHSIRVFKVLQHISSIVGALVIAFMIWRLPKYPVENSKFNFRFWGIFALIFLAIMMMRLLFGLDYRLYGHLILSSIAAGIIALILTPLLLQTKK